MLSPIFLKSYNFCKHNFISKINNGPVLLLSLYVGIETVSCHLLQQVARMEILYVIPEKLTKKVIMASAPLRNLFDSFFTALQERFVVFALKKWLQHRIESPKTANYPCEIHVAPLSVSQVITYFSENDNTRNIIF